MLFCSCLTLSNDWLKNEKNFAISGFYFLMFVELVSHIANYEIILERLI